MSFLVTDPDQMHELGLKIAAVLKAGDLVLLNGELGAGKTTLTRGIGEGLGAEGTVQSPTFVLARTHRTQKGPKLVHVDAYRLQSALELDDLDIDFARSIVVVEWARDYIDGIAQSWLSVDIDRSSEDEVRRVEMTGHGPRWQGVQIDFGN